MDSYSLANLSITVSNDLKTIQVVSRGKDPVTYSLESSTGMGITFKAQRKTLQIFRNTPVTGLRFSCEFSIPKSGRLSIRMNFITTPERNVIVVTDFDESLMATASSSVDINEHHLQLSRRGDKLVLVAGVAVPSFSSDSSNTLLS